MKHNDAQARLGSASPSYDPEPIIPIPHSLCEKAIREWLRSESANQWSAYKRGMHTKRFFAIPDEK